MKRFPITLPLAALLLSFAAAAFTPKEKAAAPTLDTIYFQFTGDAASSEEYLLEENWMQSTASGSGCSGSNLPCVVKVENQAGVTDEASLVQFLDSQSDDGESFVDNNTISHRP